LAAFTQFGSDLDAATLAQLSKGEKTLEILKQHQYSPMEVEDQVIIIYTAVNNYLKDVPKEDVQNFEKKFLEYLKTSHSEILESIRNEKILSKDIEEKLKNVLTSFISEEFKK
jgi:F-type H+-transporting ATPase subunit alpha